jgi:hypothetical protein
MSTLSATGPQGQNDKNIIIGILAGVAFIILLYIISK